MLKELNLQEMNEVNGGNVTSLGEYCNTLSMLFNPGNLAVWTDEQLNAWASAYHKHCLDYFGG